MKTCVFYISVRFIVDTTSILKLVFPNVYYFCLHDYFGGYFVPIIVTVVIVVFIYLFIYLFIWFYNYLLFFLANSTGILIFVVVIATVAFAVGVIVAFVCVGLLLLLI